MIEIGGWKSAANGVDRIAVAKKVDRDAAVGAKGAQAHAQRR
jgi:hypothetical protein